MGLDGRALAERATGRALTAKALRRLGFAARFVSGYLYDAALDGGEAGAIGSGASHAWAQVFLPGAGWAHYDPTNRITAGYDVIPSRSRAIPARRFRLMVHGSARRSTTSACRSRFRCASSATFPS